MSTATALPDWIPVVGPYRLSRRLGEGRLGVVYLGHHRETGASAAVKLIHPEHIADPERRTRIAHEVAAAQRVPRWCTAKVLAADISTGTPTERSWVASEHIDGPSLEVVLLERGRLTGDGLAVHATGVATALDAIHRHGVIHRDLKPSDVLFSPSGPRVLDFGVTREDPDADPHADHATGSGPVGPVYLAPEYRAGTTTAAGTTAADVFAWACLVIHAATGTPPTHTSVAPRLRPRTETAGTAPDGPTFAGDRADPDALAAVDALPDPLRELVVAASDSDPAGRPSAAELVEHLTRSASKATSDMLAAAAVAPDSSLGGASRPAPSTVEAGRARGRIDRRHFITAGVALTATVTVSAAATVAATAAGVRPFGDATSRVDDDDDDAPLPPFGTEIVGPISAHSRVDAVAFGAPAGVPMVATADQRVVRVWDLTTGEQIGDDLTGPATDIESIAVGELAGAAVAAAGASAPASSVYQWDLESGSPLETMAITPIGPGAVRRLGDDLIALAESDGPFPSSLRVLDLGTGQQIGTELTGFAETGFPETAVVERADDTLMVAATISRADGFEVEVWEGTTGRLLQSLPDLGVGIAGLAIASANGEPVVIYGDSRGSVQLRSIDTGRSVARLMHDGEVTALATGRLDGVPIVVSGGDHTVQVWDLSTRAPIGEPLSTGGGIISAVTIGEVDGVPVVIAGAGDGTVRVWSIAPSESTR